MSEKIYIASTLSAPVQYTGWSEQRGDNLPLVKITATIAGGAGVANKRLITPRGVVTAIDAEQYKMLQEHKVFLRHVERGFISVLPGKPADADEVAADMTGRDVSAPLVDEDFSDKGEAPTAVGGKATGNGGKRK